MSSNVSSLGGAFPEKKSSSADQSLPMDQEYDALQISDRFHVQVTGHPAGELGGDYEDLRRFLDAHPSIYFEGDGSFGWSGPGWTLFGMLYDLRGRIQYVELQGCCPRSAWDELIAKLTSFTMAARITQLPDGRLYGLQEFEMVAWPRRL